MQVFKHKQIAPSTNLAPEGQRPPWLHPPITRAWDFYTVSSIKTLYIWK